MTDYKRCGVWLAKSAKWSSVGEEHKRPVLIISNDKYNENNEEVICLHLTTDIHHEYCIGIDYGRDMEINRLVDRSAVRYDAVARYPARIFEKKLGTMKESKVSEIIKKLDSLLAR